jgi:formate hydrogenlyase subunit 3/multisubunit Na+/H+ antiporter MnhD subunit
MTPDPVLLIVFPLIAAFLTPLAFIVSKKYARFIPLLGILAMGVVSFMLLWEFIDTFYDQNIALGSINSTTGGFQPPFGISLVVTPLGALISFGMIMVALYVLITNIQKKEDDKGPWFEMMAMMATAGAVGMVITGDLFNMFVFLEITSISGTVLAALPRGNGEKGLNWRGAAGYAVISALASFLILAAIALLYGSTSTLNISQMAHRIGDINTYVAGTALLLMIIGFGIEAEIFPLNGWAPEVYRGSRWGTSTIFSGVIGKAGLIAMLKVVTVILAPALDGNIAMDILLWGGVITFIIGEAAAFTSKDLYRLWGFSSIGMFGLMLAAFSLGGRYGIYAAVMIMIGHLISKPVLFSLTGALKHKDKDLPLSALDGLASRSRITAMLFVGAALMLLGMPPSPIFWGKYFLFRQAGTGSEWLLMGLLIMGTMLEAGYIGKILWRVLPKKDVSKPFKLPITTMVMAVIAVTFGIILGAAPALLEDILDLIWIEFLDPVFLSGGVI